MRGEVERNRLETHLRSARREEEAKARDLLRGDRFGQQEFDRPRGVFGHGVV